MQNKKLIQSLVVAGTLSALICATNTKEEFPLTNAPSLSERLTQTAVDESTKASFKKEILSAQLVTVKENKTEKVTSATIDTETSAAIDPEISATIDPEIEYCLSQPDNVPYWQSDVHTNIKQWMDYKTVENKSTVQYKVLNHKNAYTDGKTGLRMYDGRICIAIGQGYGIAAGDYVDVVLANGNVFKCIVGDMKQIAHTDETNRYHIADGHVLEFIVDTNIFESVDQYPEGFEGTITKLVKIESAHVW